MVNTATPLRFEDVDLQLDSDGEVYRAKDITMNVNIGSEDLDQMGTLTLTLVALSKIIDWSITVDEVSGNFATFFAWADGVATHNLKVSKGAVTMTLFNSRCFTASNTHSSGSTGQWVLTGRCDNAVTES